MADLKPWEIPDATANVLPWEIPDKTDRERFNELLKSGKLKPVNSGSTLAGVGRQFQKGVVQGTGGIVSFPADVGTYLGDKATQGIDYMLGIEPSEGTMPKSPIDPSSVGQTISNSTGVGNPQNSAEGFANRIGQFLPSVLMGRPGAGFSPEAVGPMARTAVASAVGSEGTRQAVDGTSFEKYSPYLELGAALLSGPGYGAVEQLLRRPPEGLTRTTAALLRGTAPKNTARLGELGDEAMLLDASPSMTGLAQGVAVSPGQNADDIINAVTAREMNRPAALKKAATDSFGRYRDPQLRKEVIGSAASRKAGPMYRDAIENAPQLPTTLNGLTKTNVRTSTIDLSKTRREGANRFIGKIEDALKAKEPSVAAARLHDLRKELDSLIVYDKNAMQSMPSADKSMQSVYKDMRGTVDDILKNRLGFDAPDGLIAQGKRAQSSVDYGYDMLEGGKSAKSPQAAKVDISRKKLDPRFVKEGAAARIHNMMGTQSNDLSAIKKALGNDWNKQKLSDLFGSDKTGNALKEVETRETFSRNYADITRNSQTARRQAAEKLVNGTDAPKFTAQDTATGLALRGGAKIANKLSELVTRNLGEKNKTALAQALMKRGPEAIKLIEQLNGLPSPVASAVVRALIAGNQTSQPAAR
jgi:hypothetical protein